MSLGRSMSILVHGSAKTGKSTFAATSPKPACYIDVEGGTRFLPIRGVVWDPKSPPPEMDGSWDTAVVKVRSYDDAVSAYNWLQSGKHPFESVVIDSISELQQKLIEKVAGRNQMQTQNWGEVLRNFMGFMRDFRDLCEHPSKPLSSVVLVAMSRDKADGKKSPQLQGQAATMLPYMFDVSAATHVYSWVDDQGTKQTSHRILIGPNDFYEVGERTGGRLPDQIENPTVPSMLDFVFGPLEQPEDDSTPSTK